jgi:hypothetical protein
MSAQEAKTCPKCHEGGSYQLKEVRNGYGEKYHYWYFAHYLGLGEANGSGVKVRRVRWCYVGKRGAVRTPPCLVASERLGYPG